MQKVLQFLALICSHRVPGFMTDSLDEANLRLDLNNWANKKNPGFEAPKFVCGSMSAPWVDWLCVMLISGYILKTLQLSFKRNVCFSSSVCKESVWLKGKPRSSKASKRNLWIDLHGISWFAVNFVSSEDKVPTLMDFDRYMWKIICSVFTLSEPDDCLQSSPAMLVMPLVRAWIRTQACFFEIKRKKMHATICPLCEHETLYVKPQ